MSSNKKILNATQSTLNGIKFKSQLEKSVYTTLSQLGLCPEYEPKQFLLWEGFTPITPYYDKETDRQREKRNPHSPKMLTLKNSRFVGIRYKPDFYVRFRDLDIYIEAKGVENDVFYIKKKLFIKYLDNLYIKTGQRSMYFEIYTKRQLLQAIEIIKEYSMAKTATDKMLELVPSLPTAKDRDLANKFIAERRFQDLHDLVKSDIIKYDRLSEDEKLKSNVNEDGMNSLLAEVISYLNIIGWDDEIMNDYGYEEES